MTLPEWRALVVGGGLERIAFGAGALSAPRPVARVCQVKQEEDTPATGYLLRLLGVRDIVLGAATLASVRKPEVARKLIVVNLACQVGDGVALGQELKERGRLDAQTAVGLAFGVVGFAIWAGSLAKAPRPRRGRSRRIRTRRSMRRPKVELPLPDVGAAGETAKKKLKAIA